MSYLGKQPREKSPDEIKRDLSFTTGAVFGAKCVLSPRPRDLDPEGVAAVLEQTEWVPLGRAVKMEPEYNPEGEAALLAVAKVLGVDRHDLAESRDVYDALEWLRRAKLRWEPDPPVRTFACRLSAPRPRYLSDDEEEADILVCAQEGRTGYVVCTSDLATDSWYLYEADECSAALSDDRLERLEQDRKRRAREYRHEEDLEGYRIHL